MINTLALFIRPSQVECARTIAKARNQGHRYRTADQDRGPDNERAEMVGALSELVLVQALENAALVPRGYIAYADRPPTGPDVFLGTVGYSLKATGEKSSYICVSEKQRTSPKHQCDYLLPLSILDRHFLLVHAPVPMAEVEQWELREGRTPYRSIPLARLKPLADLSDLPR